MKFFMKGRFSRRLISGISPEVGYVSPVKKAKTLIAEILTVGSELTTGRVVDTNKALLAKSLTGLGFTVSHCSSVPDERGVLAKAVKQALTRSDLVFVTGGLGPTSDDITTEVITNVIHQELHTDRAAADSIVALLNQRRSIVTKDALRMAKIPKTAKSFINHNGMAAGFYVRYNGCSLIATPGVPRELSLMLDREIVPFLKEKLLAGNTAVYQAKRLRLFGIAEAQAAGRVLALGLEKRFPGLNIGYQVPLPEVHIVLEYRGEKSRAEQTLSQAETAVREVLQTYIFGTDDESMSAAMQKHFLAKGQSLALAESCTGGLLAGAITENPGSSKFFLGAVVAYDNSVKARDLSVSEAILKNHGAVSAECARAMACGVRERFQSDVGLSITGIAGPDGGTPEKQVGTVFMAVDHRGRIEQRELHLHGERSRIRLNCVYLALDWLRTLQL